MSGTLIHYIKQYINSVKLSFDCFITSIVFNSTCCIEMDSFSATPKAILVAIYIVLCLQNKTLVDKVQKHFGSESCWDKCTENVAALLRFFFSNTYLTYFLGIMLLLCQVHFITFFSIFKYRIFMLFLFSTYLHPILYKYNFSVSRNFYLDM